VFDLFRRWGYLEADLDPLGHLKPLEHPELRVDGEAARAARRIYCRTIGAEFMHIPDPKRRQWIQERLESEPPEFDRARILEFLIRAERFEHVLHSRYPGNKRFSIEGVAALLPLLDEIMESAAGDGAEQVVLGMSHRGRLNVLVHIVGVPPENVFARFEDVDPESILGGGDVIYHQGATGKFVTRSGRKLAMHLVSNPSHLEAVDPVAMGRARAKQERLGDDGAKRIFPVTLHGDAAFAGQGIAAETLCMADLRGFTVGGTVHVIVNNLIGFTANPEELHSSRFAADVAKRLPIPIFHVNGEDPEAVVRVARLAAEYRDEFSSDAVVDLIGFRRHGHSEIDDPTATQPLRYRKIESLPPLWQTYAKNIETDAAPIVESILNEYEQALQKARAMKKRPALRQMPSYWDRFRGGRYDPACEVETAITPEEIQEIASVLTRNPEGFHAHPKVKRLIEQRARVAAGERPVDFGMAEALAFGSLLRQGVPVRLSGQDSRRGTFDHRHAVWFDTETEDEHIPLEHVSSRQATFDVFNTILSEAAALGFEYGFSRDYPEALVIWEAQFGDFVNNAQAIVDQFIAAGEDKWGLLAGVVMLLPHGYEGQGPEHSSARVERFLQLAAEDNMQIVQPTTSAQYFHLLRRQALRTWRKPLVVFTPKSLLRSSLAASPLEDFSRGVFQPVIPDAEVSGGERLLLATGKIIHELRQERRNREAANTAIVALEQLYPFPESEVRRELDRHGSAREIVWVQEEPANMGAQSFVRPRLRRLARGRPIRSIRRTASASPATGSAKAHRMEQRTLLQLTFASRKA
jgi:2-oxoglutarate dehydrogenase E1 component